MINLQKSNQLVWKDKIIRNKQLYVYAKVHPINDVSHWWLLAKDNPRYLNEIIGGNKECNSFTRSLTHSLTHSITHLLLGYINDY